MIFFLENICILMLFRMLPIRFKYLDPIIKKQKSILKKFKIQNKTRTHRPNKKRIFVPQSHNEKQKQWDLSS